MIRAIFGWFARWTNPVSQPGQGTLSDALAYGGTLSASAYGDLADALAMGGTLSAAARYGGTLSDTTADPGGIA